MLVSARRAIVYPNTNRSDTADVPRDIAAAIAALEVDVIYGQGTLAARPTSTAGSPGIVGRIYAATDQTPHAFYWDYGTGWDPLGSLAAGSVGTTQLADDSITGGALGAGVKIKQATIVGGNLVNDTITATQIAAQGVGVAELTDTIKPSAGASGATEALRALGTAAGTAAAGTHASQHSRAGADPLVFSTFVGSGTLASRPSTSLVTGMLYTATDVDGGVEYQYNGTSWIQTGRAVFPSDEDYVQVTANGAIGAGTSGAAPTTLITGTSKAYAAGLYWVEFWAVDGLTGDVNQSVNFDLWDGATRLGRIAAMGSSNSFAQPRPVEGKTRISLTAATHQLLLRGYGTAGDGFIAGDGVGGNPCPAFLRVTRYN